MDEDQADALISELQEIRFSIDELRAEMSGISTELSAVNNNLGDIQFAQEGAIAPQLEDLRKELEKLTDEED